MNQGIEKPKGFEDTLASTLRMIGDMPSHMTERLGRSEAGGHETNWVDNWRNCAGPIVMAIENILMQGGTDIPENISAKLQNDKALLEKALSTARPETDTRVILEVIVDEIKMDLESIQRSE